jgi:cytochrome c-type biogenesis protein CcmH/NrfG
VPSVQTSPAARVVALVALLALFALVLPLRLPGDAGELSSERCLTLADQPPPGGPDAIALLEQCTTAVPMDAELLADLGGAYEANGRTADAEAAYRRVVTLDPDYADVHVRLARLLAARGDTVEAGKHAAAGLRLQPNRQAIKDLISPLKVTP